MAGSGSFTSTVTVMFFCCASAWTTPTTSGTSSARDTRVRSSVRCPLSTLARSSTSSTSARRWRPPARIELKYSSWRSLSSPYVFFTSTCEKPMTAFSGVRSSWLIEARGVGLGREDTRVDRRHQPVEILLDLLGMRTRVGIRERDRLRTGAAAQEILLRGDDAAIALERRPRRGELLALALALRILGEALEILGDAVRPLVPRRRVAGIAQHHRPLLELDERRDRLASGRGQTDGGNGAGCDLAVDGDEIADGVKAQIADDRQHDDHEQ